MISAAGLFDSSILTSLFIAFFGGILSFLSPCVLPIIPPYIAFMAGTVLGEKKTVDTNGTGKMLFISLAFVGGLSTVFLILGAAAASLGSVFLQYKNELGYLSGVIVVTFGLHFLGILKLSFLNKEIRFDIKPKFTKILAPYFLGLAFAFGWSPCIGPILGTILALSAQESSIFRGSSLLILYALGLGIPFILVALFMEKSVKIVSLIKPYMGLIEKFMGGFLIFVGFMLLTGSFTSFSFWLIEIFPFLVVLG